MTHHAVDDLESEGCKFYLNAMRLLTEADVPFLVGGAYAMEHHAGIVRRTKDFDIFLMPDTIDRALQVLSRAGYQTELTFPHWLAKAHYGDDLLDMIFSSGNGIGQVDALWFEHSVAGQVLGATRRLCPAEETIWQKAFILERDRCDSADVAHLIRARGPQLDWSRLLWRFGEHWRVLYAHLVLFGFIYPDQTQQIPLDVMNELSERMKRETQSLSPGPRVCNGTLLSATQYLNEVSTGGYADARVQPWGNMTEENVGQWTANFAKQIAQLGAPSQPC